MSNFTFLATDWPEVLEPASKAEAMACSDPRSARRLRTTATARRFW
jgi:hypothetical protein